MIDGDGDQPGGDPVRLCDLRARLDEWGIRIGDPTVAELLAKVVDGSADDLRRAADALSQCHQRLAVVLRHTRVCVYTLDTELRCTWVCNPQWGLDSAQMLGKRDDEILPTGAGHELVNLQRQVLQSRCGLRRQIAVTVGASTSIRDCTMEPTSDCEGHLVGVVVAATDITESVRAHQAAEDASRAKDHFLAVLSHELRTPLAPVLTTVQMMEAQTDLTPDLRDSLSLIRRNVEMEARLIDDLLDVTRISRGKLELHICATDLHDTIRNVLATCHGELRSRQQQLTLELAAERHFIHGDSARIQQVLWNLVKNASKFTPPGGRLSVCTSNGDGGELIMQVSDTGIGIQPDRLASIFDAFEQGGRSVTRAFGGLGLGLSISRGLMELHGGRLTASSPGTGKGATFTACFPNAITFEAVSVPTPSVMPPRPFDHGCRILLVEDHADTAHAMARVLHARGYRVRIADSVATAVAASAEPFDLLICDIGLPDGSGLELMRRLKVTAPVRGIALSGFGMEEDLRKSEEAGFAAHLTKPVDLAQLESTISRLIVQPWSAI